MRQLQFKSDRLPSELVEICLFHETWTKTFDTQLFGQLCIKYGLIFYKNDLVQFCNNYLLGTQRTPIVTKNITRSIDSTHWNETKARDRHRTSLTIAKQNLLQQIVWKSSCQLRTYMTSTPEQQPLPIKRTVVHD